MTFFENDEHQRISFENRWGWTSLDMNILWFSIEQPWQFKKWIVFQLFFARVSFPVAKSFPFLPSVIFHKIKRHDHSAPPGKAFFGWKTTHFGWKTIHSVGKLTYRGWGRVGGGGGHAVLCCGVLCWCWCWSPGILGSILIQAPTCLRTFLLPRSPWPKS